MVDIWRFTKTGNVLGVVEKFTRWVGQNAKLAIYTEVMTIGWPIRTVHALLILQGMTGRPSIAKAKWLRLRSIRAVAEGSGVV